MCGICGFFEYKSASYPVQAGRLMAMMDTMKHRGPDDYGLSFYGEAVGSADPKHRTLEYANNLLLGQRRLSIIDLSPLGRQPMISTDGSLEIVFNGELYNYLELKEELTDYNYRSKSDTEVVLAAYQKWGIAMLERLDGMFAFAIFDRNKNEIFAARDHIGIKPFYYSYVPGKHFAFGSEPKVVLKYLETTGSISSTYASEFLLFGITDHDEGTFYNEVKQLPGGHFMLFSPDKQQMEIRRFWKIPTVNKSIADPLKQYEELLYTAINRQLRSDVPLGTSLSGGIDSGTITRVASDLLGNNVGNYNALTFTFPGFKNDESEKARLTAQSAGLQWHEVIPSMDTLADDLERMIYHMGEPFSTLSMFAQYKVMEHANKLGIKVMLDGQGGDELYLGYPRMALRVMFDYLEHMKAGRFLKEWTGLKSHLNIPMMRSLASYFYFNSKVAVLNKKMPILSRYVQEDYLRTYREETAEDVYAHKNVYDKQVDELTKYCLPRLLRYADRNSMAFSVESRVPHLSTLLLNYNLSLPLEWRVNNGWTKYIVRKAMSNKLPDDIIWNTVKLGFDIPQQFWVEKLNSRIRQWVDGLDNNGPIRKDAVIADLADKQKSGSRELWGVISLIGMHHINQAKFK